MPLAYENYNVTTTDTRPYIPKNLLASKQTRVFLIMNLNRTDGQKIYDCKSAKIRIEFACSGIKEEQQQQK